MRENTVFIGSKPLMNYVLAIVTQFNTTDAEEVVVKARGRAISTAVDVVEVTKNRFLPGITYKDIRLGTDIVKREDGSNLNISSLEIVLSLPAPKKPKAVAEKEQKEEKPAAKKEQKEEKPAAKKEQKEEKPAAKKEQKEEKPAEQ
jgi:DNA-binding protein